MRQLGFEILSFRDFENCYIFEEVESVYEKEKRFCAVGKENVSAAFGPRSSISVRVAAKADFVAYKKIVW